MADVFISYRRDDQAIVERIAERLRGLNVDVWFDTRLTSGTSFDETINREIRKSKCVLVCWSPEAVASDWVRAEAAIGREENKLATVFLRPTKLPAPFNLIHAEDLSDWAGEDVHRGWLNTLARIGELIGRDDIVARARKFGAVGGGGHGRASRKGGGGGLLAVLALLILLGAGAGGAFWWANRGAAPGAVAGAPETGVVPDEVAAPAEPDPTAPPPVAPPAGFRVIELTASVDTPAHTGACPHRFNFSARVSAIGGSGAVTYRWVRSDGASAPVRTAQFDGPGTQDLTADWTLGAQGAHWMALEILEPAPQRSNEAGFTVTCQAPPAEPGRPRPAIQDVVDRPVLRDAVRDIPVLVQPRRGEVTLRQTYLLDLDGPIERSEGADLWYNARTATDRALVARGGQTALLAAGTTPSFRQCQTANFGVSASLDLASDAGRWMCVRTSENRIGAVSFATPPGPSPSPVTLRYLLWN